MTTLTAARDKFAALQASLGTVFTEAKTSDGQYDFQKVAKETLQASLGMDAKAHSTIDVVKRINEKNAELDEAATAVEALEAAEKAASSHSDREKAVRGLPMPGGDKARSDSAVQQLKALGDMVSDEKAYRDWVERGAPDGITLQFDEYLPSDMLAKGLSINTIGSKAAMTTSAGWAPESVRLPGFVEAATRPVQLLDIVPMARTGQAAIPYMEETTRNHGAAEVAEGGDYGEAEFVLTEKNGTIVKIGTSIPVTDEQLEDVDQSQSYINSRLVFGIRQRLDGQILVGNGTTPNMRGLKNTVGIQTQAKGADPVPDVFYKAMTKIRVTGRAIPTHHVINPTDWQGVRLMRTADGVYIWGNPSEAGPERLWGLPVVQCDADAAGTGYVGAFNPAFVSLFERRGVDVQVGFVGSQFTKGQRTIRADTRMGIVFFRPAAFCSCTGL
ncbi:phage major capsid protein [Maricaulis maris]|uniref:HK97 family phage major capsid protein n=1 Tax=Maricaulis maris TaxID=74318 RepID=A0A495DL02_9PROT|nr:phage major capsid protein [Maricaulis maris]RKR03585.1 HK97 family phage major capsid protein [Maricaulis maris]